MRIIGGVPVFGAEVDPGARGGTFMKNSDVRVGETYVVKVSRKLANVRITGESPYGGWDGVNIETKREVRIKSAARLRRLAFTSSEAAVVNSVQKASHGIDQELRALLRKRAKTLSLTTFSDSLSPDEYRELTFFWGSVVHFWEENQ